jgi:hypothetical protein
MLRILTDVSKFSPQSLVFPRKSNYSHPKKGPRLAQAQIRLLIDPQFITLQILLTNLHVILVANLIMEDHILRLPSLFSSVFN